jgi:DNA-directed RNA polymerase specialized sigma24 family protein
VANDLRAVVDAVHDLTRVVIAIQGNFGSKADVVRRLADLSIPPARIAAILDMPQNQVHSVLTKARKKTKNTDSPGEGENGSTA